MGPFPLHLTTLPSRPDRFGSQWGSCRLNSKTGSSLIPSAPSSSQRKNASSPNGMMRSLPPCLKQPPGAAETLALLVEHLPTRFPEMYKRSGDRIDNLTTGQRWRFITPPLHPLDLAGRLVQEDLCLMQRQAHTQVYHLVGASLCFRRAGAWQTKSASPSIRFMRRFPAMQNSSPPPWTSFLIG